VYVVLGPLGQWNDGQETAWLITLRVPITITMNGTAPASREQLLREEVMLTRQAAILEDFWRKGISRTSNV
jgi:hypothetical protein